MIISVDCNKPEVEQYIYNHNPHAQLPICIISELKEGFKAVANADGVLILRGLNITSPEDLVFFIENTFDGITYNSGKDAVPNVECFEVTPFIDITPRSLSETSKTGGFHTDFWNAEIPPKFIALNCINEDPKHPFYGRNQYIPVNLIYSELERLMEYDLLSLVKSLTLTYVFKSNISHTFDNGSYVRFHEKLAEDVELRDNLSFLSLIREISLSICDDFALAKGDTAIINNHRGLHRRGEATVRFCDNAKKYHSRLMSTMRFDV